ncbi:tripartite motif-containing protein 16-like [Girardinichthys multiradiatus]|uniref:tripartite motif-containing protein 16-like n=1 Tax=Girardinichthys multiradiatus TaxID=208333 RepID=UPI001FABE434|nr:tripartite motif-containing protein 16-like [Girardinichthys multiradiatus]
MAQRGIQLEKVSCSICLDLLKDPVTIPCGHSYCRNGIKTHWDVEDKMRIPRCPQCRKTFIRKPVLEKNILLAELVEDLKKTGLQAAPADHCYAGPEDVACDVCTGRKMKAVKSCLVCLTSYCENHLQPHYDVTGLKKHKLVEPSKELQQNICTPTSLIQKRSSDVKQQIRSQQETEVSRVKDLQEKLEQKITELKKKDAELKQLSNTEDHNQFLHNYPSLSALSESTHSSSINIRPLRYFEDVTAAVSELRDKLQDILRDTWTNISLRVTEGEVLLSEPKTRPGFLKHSQEIALDPNTANRKLLLSEGNRKVTRVDEEQTRPDHPDRLTCWFQVLSRESLTGCCYWEVQWRGREVDVVVSYKNISRAGRSDESLFGANNKCWVLYCNTDSYRFYHNNNLTPVSGPVSSRIGVYLDHRAGILSFYSVSETMTLLHRVQTTFTQPLHAGIGICNVYESSAEFIKLK